MSGARATLIGVGGDVQPLNDVPPFRLPPTPDPSPPRASARGGGEMKCHHLWIFGIGIGGAKGAGTIRLVRWATT